MISSMCAGRLVNGGTIPCAVGVPSVTSYVIGGFITVAACGCEFPHSLTGVKIKMPMHEPIALASYLFKKYFEAHG